MINAKSVAALLRTSRSIGLILHQNPDGDAIGSALALRRALPDKKIRLTCSSRVATIFTEALGTFDCVDSLSSHDELFVILDCPDLQRTGFATELKKLSSRKRILVVDHHQKGNLSDLTEEYHLNREASSTCEMVAEIIDELRVPVTRGIATALLLGIHSDTGGFQHPNTSSNALMLAARLVRHGADFEMIRGMFSPKRETRKLRLWGEVLGTVSINSLGIAVAKVSQAVLIKTNATEDDLSGLAKYLCAVEGTKAALVLVETADGWRGSLRTHSRTFNVGRLAKLLGGNGGKKVAGFLATDADISGTMGSVERISAVKKAEKK